MHSKKSLLEALRAAVESENIDQIRSLTRQLNEQAEGELSNHSLNFFEPLQRSVESFDHAQTKKLCRGFRSSLQTGNSPFPVDGAKKILHLLHRKRLFSELRETADVLIQTGTNAPVIMRLYAQALIEGNLLSACLQVLKQLETRCQMQDDGHELSETRGLLGRVHKQIFINGAQSGTPGNALNASLEASYKYYAAEFQTDKSKLWHGVNMLALWHRAERDGVELPQLDAAETAKRMLQTVQAQIRNTTSQKDISMWTQASAAEINIAVGDYEQALKWIGLYVDDMHVKDNNSDAFQVGSTLRQLEQVWQFDNHHPQQARILQVLRSALLKRRGGSIQIQDLASESGTIEQLLENTKFEKLLGKERFNNLKWLQTGLDRARCVCKIEDQFGDGIGTGFIIQPEKLMLSHPQQWVVLTNAHVVSSDPTEQCGSPAALAPDQAVIRFEASEHPDRVYKVSNILASSPRMELDFSVLALEENVDFPYPPMPLATQLPAVDQNQRIYVIGHPQGGNISFSLYDNMLLDHEIPKLHYRSPTQGGSSGSPVFNQSWGLIGQHHAGGTKINKLNGQSGQYAANEGHWIGSIADMIKNKEGRH